MTVRRAEVLDLMIRDPEVPRSLRFAVHRIENLLTRDRSRWATGTRWRRRIAWR